MSLICYLFRNQRRERSEIDVKPPTSAKSSRRKSARKSARMSQDNMEVTNSISLASSRTQNDSQLLGSRLKDIENEVKKGHDRTHSSKSMMITDLISDNDSFKQTPQTPQKPPSASTRRKSDVLKEESLSSKSRPGSSQAPPKSAKSRPQTTTRAQSRQGQQSRAQSRQGSRPSSRANSRMGSSRATSRAET